MAQKDPVKDQEESKHEASLTDHEIEAIEDHTPIRAVAIFESIRREGRMELLRPTSALTMSGFVAGLAIGLSVLSQGLLRSHLPVADWRPLVESLGYSIGFLIVILGQMQLFTENTIKAVCPVLDDTSARMFRRLARLWGLVLGSNLAGAATFGAVLWMTRNYQPDVWRAMHDISLHAVEFGTGEIVLRGIGAGWLVAALVWMTPNSGDARALMVIAITYLISLAGFAHVVAGATEVSLLILSGDLGFFSGVVGFLLPATVGNLLGGSVFFTILAWVQIRTELQGEDDDLIEAFRGD
ncbi:formate/nitrite transporter family protein [Defluviimonas sp. WL0002]|uniref:Formate/nitrite transporter family protein n=1 Tax=Albidovulum marisflavi TaxID=2984159 RepID=A0ABT2ZCI1_9RHOB|nr:formate/nitrite transporter family protein [Defluviimonas sp. WL0002]MCV2868850.1 formate/nitrite transporter family protein [Defluviimonas sp. WL0002]